MYNCTPAQMEQTSQNIVRNVEAPNSRRKSSHPQGQKLSKELLSRHYGLQDVFMLCHSNDVVELANSSHVGHQLFKSLAELNKTKFVENVKRDPKRPIAIRIALQLLNSVTNKGRGKIYIQVSGCDEWKEISDQEEGRGFVFRALLSLFGIEDHVKKPEILPDEEAPPSPQSALKRTASPDLLPPKKRVRFDSSSSPISQEQHPTMRRMDAATTLARMVGEELIEPLKSARGIMSQHAPAETIDSVSSSLSSSDTSATSRRAPKESMQLPAQLMTEKLDLAGSLRTSTKMGFEFPPLSFLAGSFSSKAAAQSRAALNSKGFSVRLSSSGITNSQLRPNDVIVGGSGVGAMDLPSTGNRRFRSLVESKTEAFSKFEKKAMLRMAQVTVSLVHEAGGRLLAIDPKSGLLHEVKKDVAWTKTLRTYKEFVTKHQQMDSIRKFNEAIQKQESMERMQQFVFPGDSRSRVEQMLEEVARAQQGQLNRKMSLHKVPVLNNARVLAFSAKVRPLSPP
jgi:hypothetical protein